MTDRWAQSVMMLRFQVLLDQQGPPCDPSWVRATHEFEGVSASTSLCSSAFHGKKIKIFCCDCMYTSGPILCTSVETAAHLINTVEPVLHTLDGIVLPVLDVLRLEHLAEGPLSLFGYQPVLPHLAPAAGTAAGAAAASAAATTVSAPEASSTSDRFKHLSQLYFLCLVPEHGDALLSALDKRSL